MAKSRRGPDARVHLSLYCLLAACSGVAVAGDAQPQSVQWTDHGRLEYRADARGNRVVDFSHAGYEGGGVAIPFVPARIVVEPDGTRDRERIQAALDLVAALPVGADGFRGAVLLKPGRYAIDTQLRIRASGVVLRGSGDGADGTVLVATGTSRRTLIEISGHGDRVELADSRVGVADEFVPVGALNVPVTDATGFAVGDRVVVRRPCTAEWIRELEVDVFPGWRADGRLHWRPGSRDIVWERVIVARSGNTLTLDAPLTTSLDPAFGGGSVAKYEFPGRIDHVGIENLRCVSAHLPAVPDEEHAWVCVALDKVEDAWVRQLTARHFVGYVVHAQADSSRLTIEDCSAEYPVSEIASYRRRVFSIGGQQILVQRCRSNQGRRDFTTGFAATGPNVFLHCRASEALDWCGPAESWASGVLYDNVIIRGNALRLINRGIDAQGAGWAAANSLLWNCEATDIEVQSPPGAVNQAYGTRGDVTNDRLDPETGLAALRDFGRGGPIPPASLYLTQLAERKGADAVKQLARADIPTTTEGARPLTNTDVEAFVARETAHQHAHGLHPLRVENGAFTIDGQPAWTSTVNYSWYQGQMPRPLASAFGPAITRFAPGETGPGLTDDLEAVADGLPPGAVFAQHYGLWYERRRVNHNFYGAPEHRDGNVWAPFMEMPWARSGEGKDWNGLSKHDLTKFNPWYFQRVEDFAQFCATRGRVLLNYFYFQHALQETRAHYVDFPWRPVNCLQATDLPDENPAASAFYDISHPVRRELHRLYLRHTLDVLGDETNVVFGLDPEYSGPLSFVEFVLDTIAEWQREHDRKVFVFLSVPREQMDAILADPARGPLVTAITFHHWFYRPDGSLYTITGGINRAPREQSVNIITPDELAQLRAANTNPTWNGSNIVSSPAFQRRVREIRAGTPALRYRALREYRDAFPDLVIVNQTDEFPDLTAVVEQQVPAEVRARMRPAPLVRDLPTTAWCMAARGETYLVYAMAGQAVELDLSVESGAFSLVWLDASTGAAHATDQSVTAGRIVTLAPPGPASPHPRVAWLRR